MVDAGLETSCFAVSCKHADSSNRVKLLHWRRVARFQAHTAHNIHGRNNILSYTIRQDVHKWNYVLEMACWITTSTAHSVCTWCLNNFYFGHVRNWDFILHMKTEWHSFAIGPNEVICSTTYNKNMWIMCVKKLPVFI